MEPLTILSYSLFSFCPLRAYCPFSLLLLSERCQTFGGANPFCCLLSSSRVHPFHWWRSAHGEKNINNPFWSLTEDGKSLKDFLTDFFFFCHFATFFQVVLCGHLGVWCLCRHLFCDLRLCGWHHTGAWEEYSVRFGKDLSQENCLNLSRRLV